MGIDAGSRRRASFDDRSRRGGMGRVSGMVASRLHPFGFSGIGHFGSDPLGAVHWRADYRPAPLDSEPKGPGSVSRPNRGGSVVWNGSGDEAGGSVAGERHGGRGGDRRNSGWSLGSLRPRSALSSGPPSRALGRSGRAWRGRGVDGGDLTCRFQRKAHLEAGPLGDVYQSEPAAVGLDERSRGQQA